MPVQDGVIASVANMYEHAPGRLLVPWLASYTDGLRSESVSGANANTSFMLSKEFRALFTRHGINSGSSKNASYPKVCTQGRTTAGTGMSSRY